MTVRSPRVEYLDDEPNGIASIVGGLIEANLKAHPERAALLRRATVGMVAPDAGVALTLHLAPGRVLVANGLLGRPDVVVRADSATLTELSSTPLRLGFPDAMTRQGREVTRKLIRGDMKVKGILRRPGVVSRLNRLLSVGH
ncbi:MAG TPA: hypothetical protein VG602_03385 [Actinomycetota bacterium]|nr:hypothetical protein [Actinomycetota bacterium]